MAWVALLKAQKVKASNKRPASTNYATADRAAPGFKGTVKAGIQDLGKARGRDVADAIRRGDLKAVEQLLTPGDPAFKKLSATLKAQYRELLANAGDAEMSRSYLMGRFDLVNPRSVEWAAKQAGRMQEQLGRSAGRSVSQVIQNGLLDGIPPDKMAAQIANHIGLTPRDSAAVDRRYKAALDAGMPRSRALAQREQYAQVLLDQRAETIARTETIAAEAAGQQAAWAQAQDAGILSPDSRRVWIAALVGCCETCAALNDGPSVGLFEPFVTPDGVEVMHPPLHPRCRCTVGLE